MIAGVKHVTIPVQDQDRALEFYTQKLGFKLVVDAPFDGSQRWIELQIPDAETQVVLFTPEGHQERIGTFMPLGFTSSDVRKSYEELKQKGVEFLEPPKEEPWGVYTLFKDCEGNTFCLSSS